MAVKEYDAVIIGAGAAGLTVGAVLAAKEHKRVLIVEKEPEVGGRLASFVGGKHAVSLLGKELDVQGYRNVLRGVHTWMVRANPELPALMEQGFLDGYTFEAGVHVTFWGNKGRVACVLDYLGKHIDLPGNEGFTVINPQDNKWYPIQRPADYAWMTPEANEETKRLLREMSSLSLKEAARYDLTSLGQWLNEQTSNRQVYEYLAALASIHMVTGEPDLIPAGDFLKFMAVARDIGMNLITGSTGTAGPPGFVHVTAKLAETVRENGGDIMLGTPVVEVIVADKKAKGVIVQTQKGPLEIEAPSVVCTVPINHALKIIPEGHFPPDFVKMVEERFWNAGMLSGFVGLKRDIIQAKQVNPKTWLLVPSIIKADEGYIGDVDIIFLMSSSFNPLRAPEGKHLLEFSIALTGEEMHDNQKVNRVIDETTAFMQRNFPTWLEDMDWQLWTASDEGFGIWPPIGERQPDVKCPRMESLYFAGDGYGVHRWGSGIDAAIHSAILCLDSLSSRDYSSEILPGYHR